MYQKPKLIHNKAEAWPEKRTKPETHIYQNMYVSAPDKIQKLSTSQQNNNSSQINR